MGGRSRLVGCLAGSVLALWLLPLFEGLGPLVAITALFSIWNGCGVVTQTYIAAALPDDVQGTGPGTLKAVWMVVGASSPLLVGPLADYGHFDGGFLLLAVVGSVGLVLSLFRL